MSALLDGGQLLAPESSNVPFTTVSGIGLWGNWTRSFKTPLMACLDLIDNAFDAALKPMENGAMFRGRIYIDRRFHAGPPSGSASASASRVPGDGARATRESISITNNVKDPMKPLGEALKIYNSRKHREEEIGENGVGLKQGCAALSDTNFIFSRTGTEIALGFVAKDLQKAQGCWLPCFEFAIDEDPDDAVEVRAAARREVDRILSTEAEIRNLMRDYGGSGVLVENLCEIFCEGPWKDEDYVFRVYLADLKHRNLAKGTGEKLPCLIDELKVQLPVYYIHVPVEMTIRVAGEVISFSYWQRRLIELSRIQVNVNKYHSLNDYDNSDPTWTKTGYKLSLYCGFDSVRACRKGNTALSLFIYSRKSGRLINKSDDARHALSLGHSGTDLCQGLTVIVDDYHGNLPLDPVKQNIAFSEEDGAQAHESNFYAWISGVAKFYWNFHADKYAHCGRKKSRLMEAVQAARPAVEKEIAKRNTYVMSLGRAALTRYENIPWNKRKTSGTQAGKATFKIFVATDTISRDQMAIVQGAMPKEFRLVAPPLQLMEPTTPDPSHKEPDRSLKRKSDRMTAPETLATRKNMNMNTNMNMNMNIGTSSLQTRDNGFGVSTDKRQKTDLGLASVAQQAAIPLARSSRATVAQSLLYQEGSDYDDDDNNDGGSPVADAPLSQAGAMGRHGAGRPFNASSANGTNGGSPKKILEMSLAPRQNGSIGQDQSMLISDLQSLVARTHRESQSLRSDNDRLSKISAVQESTMKDMAEQMVVMNAKIRQLKKKQTMLEEEKEQLRRALQQTATTTDGYDDSPTPASEEHSLVSIVATPVTSRSYVDL